MTREVAEVLMRMKQARVDRIQKLLYGFVRHQAVNQLLIIEIIEVELLDAEIKVLEKITKEN